MSTRPRVAATPQAIVKANAHQRQIEHAGLTWIDMIHPEVAQVAYLRDRFAFDPLTLEDVLSKIQRPKLDVYAEAEYLFIVLHFPAFDKLNRLATANEVDLFVGRDYVITLHDGSLKPLRRLFAAVGADEHARAQLMGRGSGYLLYRIVEALVRHCFPMLYRVDEQIAQIEAHIYGRHVREVVRELSYVRRDITALRRIIRPNLPVIQMLEAHERAFLRLDGEAYFGDIGDGFNKLWDMLEEQKEIVEGLNATLDSLTAQRINEVMKILTVISAVLLPMTLVAGIYGMNIRLPFEQHPYAFAIVLVVMLGTAAGMVAYFRHKNWI
jgi:magnesium transporter